MQGEMLAISLLSNWEMEEYIKILKNLKPKYRVQMGQVLIYLAKNVKVKA